MGPLVVVVVVVVVGTRLCQRPAVPVLFREKDAWKVVVRFCVVRGMCIGRLRLAHICGKEPHHYACFVNPLGSIDGIAKRFACVV